MSTCKQTVNMWGYPLDPEGNQCGREELLWSHDTPMSGCRNNPESCIHHKFVDDEFAAFVYELQISATKAT